ncbi:MAG TPA: MoaD/ThiS family protein [Anaerolineae bacterium]|nr:MoaD/ThiS family protein [Anaerolineae bacterium]HOR00902.1 MoaD/ThiS family protein [Anaerolineae bacterium]HPL28624.1 MoaD/ThiS family protein [Anaerolineae bacterium]
MPVQVVPVGLLRPLLASDTVTLDVGAGKTVAQLLDELGVQADLVAMVLVNGRQAPKDTVLQDGDVVKLIPFVGGG